ncbi:MAG: SDR family oxidoreductase [Verrucomicrobia bacterium]|nr:SDR family oxidoreductase [Verrucomicrobiota bacterium]MCH8511564.1 SDR family oxidoreductase [Kiritimatiellia bacterium]
MNLTNKRILVTGGAVRIGREIATRLSKEGADVVIHYRSHSDEAEELAEILRTSGGRADTVSGDLSTESGCESVLEQAFDHGPLYGLVNNAAVFNRTSLADSDRQAFIQEFGPNLFGPLALMRGMASQNLEGVIINLLDRRIAAHDAGAAPYHLSKIALAEATRLAAIEFGPRLRVNGVAPGAILPPPGREHERDYLQKHGGRAPLNHRCTPADIADAVLYLLTAPAVTGQIIFVDGGQHLLGNGV